MSDEKERAAFEAWWREDAQDELRKSCAMGWGLHIWRGALMGAGLATTDSNEAFEEWLPNFETGAEDNAALKGWKAGASWQARASLPVGVPKYTEAVGQAGEDYRARFPYAHPLPAQWRWAELFDLMLAATPSAPAAPTVKAELSADDATELALLREYRLSGIAFNDAHGEGYTVEQSNRAEQRMEAAEKACWDFYAGRKLTHSAPAGEAVPVGGVEAPDSVDFGFDDCSVKVSQEAYAIFLAREQHLRDAIAALELQLAGGDSVSVPREMMEAAAVVEYTGYEPANSLRWLNKGLAYMEPGTLLYAQQQSSITTAIERCEKEHGSLRAAAQAIGVDPGYLSRLKSGEKLNPSDEVLAALGLERVVAYRALLSRNGNGGEA